MESISERKVTEALTSMSVAEDLLIKAIGEFGNDKIQNALLKYQDRKKEYYSVKLQQGIEFLKANNYKCTCTPDETTGATQFMCCNICGKHIDDTSA